MKIDFKHARGVFEDYLNGYDREDEKIKLKIIHTYGVVKSAREIGHRMHLNEEDQKKKMRQLSGGMKRRVGLVQALLHEPDFLIVDEPTTGLDPEERIRIRNLLVDFAEERTVLFSTHVVEDLMATCNQLAVMKKGRFLYTGTMRELLNKARGHVWECCTEDESLARELERKYHISSKQYTEEGIRLRLLGENMPSESGCIACDVTLEDAYIYVTNR